MATGRPPGRLLSRATRRRTQAHIRHLTAVPPAAAQGLVGQVYAQVERDFGLLAPPISLHAPAPGPLAGAWLMLRETLLATGAVRRPVKEAVAVAVSQLNACPYCVDVHGAALSGLVGPGEAEALVGGRSEPADRQLAAVAGWVRAGRDRTGPPPFPPRQAPELVGTAVTFHYLNRMVNMFLAESPIPAGAPAAVRRTIRRVAGALLRPALRREVRPGGSLGLLPAEVPAGRSLPADLSWAAGNPVIGEAFARAAAAIEAAGERSVPDAVRDLVAGSLSGWDGQPPGASRAWVHQALAALPVDDRPAGQLALLAAQASYQVGPSVVDEFRRYRPDDRSLVEVASWASMAAARRLGAGLWQGQQYRGGR